MPTIALGRRRNSWGCVSVGMLPRTKQNRQRDSKRLSDTNTLQSDYVHLPLLGQTGKLYKNISQQQYFIHLIQVQ